MASNYRSSAAASSSAASATTAPRMVKIQSKKPLCSTAPRIRRSNARKPEDIDFVFNSFADVVKCLEEGTLVLNSQIKESDFEKECEFYNATVKAVYSNHGEGRIMICLQDSDNLMFDDSNNRLIYMLRNDDKAGIRKQSEEDTYADFMKIGSAIMETILPLAQSYFSEYTFTPFIPDYLKMALPKNNVYKPRKTGGFDVSEGKKFDLEAFAYLSGKYVIQLSQIWIQKSSKKDNLQVSAGINILMCKFKQENESDSYLPSDSNFMSLKPLISKFKEGSTFVSPTEAGKKRKTISDTAVASGSSSSASSSAGSSATDSMAVASAEL